MPKVEINYQLDFFLYLLDKNVKVDFICLDNNTACNFPREGIARHGSKSNAPPLRDDLPIV